MTRINSEVNIPITSADKKIEPCQPYQLYCPHKNSYFANEVPSYVLYSLRQLNQTAVCISCFICYCMLPINTSSENVYVVVTYLLKILFLSSPRHSTFPLIDNLQARIQSPDYLRSEKQTVQSPPCSCLHVHTIYPQVALFALIVDIHIRYQTIIQLIS